MRASAHPVVVGAWSRRHRRPSRRVAGARRAAPGHATIATGYGYTGIVVATLGGLTALGVLPVDAAPADITVGAQNASLVLQLPPQLGQVFGALLLLSVLGAALSRYRLEWRRRES